MSRKLRFGVQTPPQNTTWQELVSVWKTIDQAGYDTAWVFDHFFPIFSDPSGPCFEAWVALTALVLQTSKIEAGVLVTGNTYRHPPVLAKMAATLDHATGGRLILGIGAGWFEQEHKAYGIPFYTTAERIGRLDESIQIIKSLWTQPKTTFEGRYYSVKDAAAEPKPLRKPHPPVLIGAAGERMNLKVVAKHADIWNTFGSPAVFSKKIQVLREHCANVGRNFDEIEISWAGFGVICDSKAMKQEVLSKVAATWGRSVEEMEQSALVGTVDEIRARIDEFTRIGVTHFIVGASSPFDHAGLRRFAAEVIPKVKS
ncbi:MAG TPA: LLM class F420-dependent oxidoreductase [Terriglobia bacterium]|nr:LLM class F420-dependent oxidoreductase [Terriglobia bacterium]